MHQDVGGARIRRRNAVNYALRFPDRGTVRIVRVVRPHNELGVATGIKSSEHIVIVFAVRRAEVWLTVSIRAGTCED
jgi:hypothetical protein